MVNENDIKYKPQLNSDISESNNLDADVKANSKLNATQNEIVIKNEVKSNNDNVKGTWLSDQLCTNSTLKDTITLGHKSVDVNNENIPSRSGASNLGDYTNIRATTGHGGFREGDFINKTSMDITHDHCIVAGMVNATNIQIPQQSQQLQQSTQHTQASAFSFKHFLSNCNVLTAPSSRVTSLDFTNSNIINSTVNSTTMTTSKPLQTSTGARPKVPQTIPASFIGGHNINGNLTSPNSNSTDNKVNVTTISSSLSSSSSKMKRSPRFASFDSQACLSEYVDTTNLRTNLHHTPTSAGIAGVTSNSTEHQLYSYERQTNDYETWNLPTTSVAAAAVAAEQGDNLGQYVQRSYSNYDVTRPQTSPFRRYTAMCDTVKDNRPTRLSLNMNCSTSSNTNTNCGGGGDSNSNGNGNANSNAKLKLDLPIHKCPITNRSNSAVNRIKNLSADFQYRAHATNPNRSSTDVPTTAQQPPGTASALPDFVQDHWMDSWYSYDMQLNSPNTSPVDEFFKETKCGDGSNEIIVEPDINVNRSAPSLNVENSTGSIERPSSMGNNLVNHNAIISEMNSVNSSSVQGGSKMLPDFLSDGPIIHSSQRLADIATGLPSNRISSPQDSTVTTQLTRMREENERLQRELTETQMALCEQTKRANDLERQVLEYQKTRYKLAVNDRNNALPKESLVEEGETKERKKHSMYVGPNHEMKLKQHILKLTTELEALRREREREGAVGGFNVTSCDYSTTQATLAGTTSAASGTGATESATSSVKVSNSIRNSGVLTTDGIRLSRSQHFARQLLTAAANAEGNLRQLLAGVDNLRQMAADIEHSNINFECLDANPDLFSEFLDECDDDNDDDDDHHYEKFNLDKFNL